MRSEHENVGARGLTRALVLIVGILACGSDRRPADRDASGVDAATDTATDTATPSDSGSDSASPSDSGPDARTDARPTDTGSRDGGALDPALSPAGPDGDVCDTPGSLGECPSVQVCRFFDASTSRCESCGPCGNLGASCATSAECDILFACYAGRCTNICPLGTSYCGPPDDCLDVGHPTHGVCDPASL